MGFPKFGSVGKESACSAGDLGSIPGLGQSPGEGNGNPLQDYCLENPMDRGAIVYMYHSFFIHSSVDGHLGCFHVLAIVNNAAVNNGIHMSFSILVSSGYMPRSGIAGSYGSFIPSF